MEVTRQARGFAARWVGPALAVAGFAAVLAALFDPRAEPSEFEFGALYTLKQYDQALSLLGLGIAIAQAPLRLCLLSAATFAAGILSGSVVSDWLASAIAAHPGLVGYVFLTGPFSCVIVGLTLVAPRLVRNILLLPTAVACGATLGLVLSFSDLTIAQWAFAAGAVSAGLWLVAAPLLMWRSFARPWFAMPSRIFGSWLIAIGVMLGGAQLIPSRSAPPPSATIPADPGAPPAIEPHPEIPGPSEEADPVGLPDSAQ